MGKLDQERKDKYFKGISLPSRSKEVFEELEKRKERELIILK
ncbi:MAG: hypothetical protein NTY71_02165 [Methanoregula sp.]|nr:hypothetical protein [Methanoregula sp.]